MFRSEKFLVGNTAKKWVYHI